MIQSREEFEYSIKSVAKMYDIRDRDAAETLYHPSTRASIVESTNAMIRKIEREIAAYLAAHAQELSCGEEAEDVMSTEKTAEPIAA